MAQQNAFWATTFVPWIQFPPQSARPDYNYYTSRYDIATKLYSGLTLWEIVAIILVLVLFLIIVVLILLCLYHTICGRTGAGTQSNWCPCDCWSWLCCGCTWCQPYQPYKRRPPPATVVEDGPCERGYVGGATRYNGKSLETRSIHGDVDRVVVIKEQIKERSSSDDRRPVVHRQQLLTSGYDNDAYSQSGRLATTDTNDRDVVAVVHRYEDDDMESSYNQRPTAIAHLSVDRAGYGGNGGYPGGSDIGNGYHSAAYDVVTSGGTVRYPSLHSLR